MKPYRDHHLRYLRVCQETAAEWAAEAMHNRMLCVDPQTDEDAARFAEYALMVEDAAQRARDWSASAREVYDELLERDAANAWLRVE